TPTVTATLTSPTFGLNVVLGSPNDSVTITGTSTTGAAVSVFGTGMGLNTFDLVTSITVSDAGSNSGQSVTFASNGSNTIGVGGGTTPVGGLVTDAPGTTSLKSSVTTVGGQAYNDPLTLTGDAVLTSTAGANILFGNTVKGNFDLTVNTAGQTTFSADIGGG